MTSPDEVVGREEPVAAAVENGINDRAGAGSESRSAAASSLMSGLGLLLQSSMTERRRDCGLDSEP